MAADELSECVQDFYHNLSERLQAQFKGTADLQNPQADIKYHRHFFLLLLLLLCCLSFFLLLLGSLEQVEAIMDEVEKYMMSRLYKEVFCPETTDDEKKDLAIQKRIR